MTMASMPCSPKQVDGVAPVRARLIGDRDEADRGAEFRATSTGVRPCARHRLERSVQRRRAQLAFLEEPVIAEQDRATPSTCALGAASGQRVDGERRARRAMLRASA